MRAFRAPILTFIFLAVGCVDLNRSFSSTSDVARCGRVFDDSNLSSSIELRTERLVLRPVVSTDTDRLHEMWTHPETRDLIGAAGLYSKSDVREEIENAARSLADFDQPEATIIFGVEQKPDGIPDGISDRKIGTVILHRTKTPIVENHAAVSTSRSDYSVGFLISPEWTSRGLATEALKRAVDFAFNEGQGETITATVLIENKRSIAVLKKNGFLEMKKSPPGTKRFILAKWNHEPTQ